MGALVRGIMTAGRLLGGAFTALGGKIKAIGRGIRQTKIDMAAFSNMAKGLGKMEFPLPSLSGAKDGLLALKDIAASIVMPGFTYTKEIETAKQGIAGVLQAMSVLQGETLSFGQALELSEGVMKKLEKDAVQTSSTTEELAAAFQRLLAPGLDAGLDLEQIETLTAKGMSTGKGIGLSAEETAKELEGILKGDVKDAKLTELMGITPEAIAQAKESAEGLFAFLAERLQVFDGLTEGYQDSLAGKMEKLEEIGVIVSGKFTEAFEPEIKECLDFVTDMIGQVNEQTGEVEINPAILGFIQDLKAGWQELVSYVDDALRENEGTIDNYIEVLGSLYHSVCNLGKAFFDFLRIFDAFGGGLRELVSGALAYAAEAVEWLTDKLHGFLDAAARIAGLKSGKVAKTADVPQLQLRSVKVMAGIAAKAIASKEGVPASRQGGGPAEERQRRAADQARREAEQAEKERIRSSQAVMKEMLQYWKENLAEIKRRFGDAQEALQFSYKQGGLSSDEYYEKKLSREIDFSGQSIENLDRRMEEVQNAAFANESERQSMLRALAAERQLAAETLAAQKGAFHEMTEVLAAEKEGRLPEGKEFQSKEAYEAVLAHQKALEPARELLRQFNALGGDISSDKLADLEKQRRTIKNQLALYGGDKTARDAMDKVNAVFDNEKIKLNYEQIKRDMDKANEGLATAEQAIFDDLISGKISIGEADERYAALYKETLSKSAVELERLLKETNISDETAKTIKAELRRIQNTLDSGFANILKGLDEKLRRDIARITADPRLTRMQRESAIDSATRAANQDKALAAQNEIDRLNGLSEGERGQYEKNKSESIEKALDRLKNELTVYDQLSEIPSLLDKIDQAGKQVFEDGLFQFLSEGINECKNLGEAFRNLGKSILQSMQQVIADRLTREFMNLFMPKFAGGGAVENGELPRAATGGRISGRGTGTSDSILAWLSNGEYVIKASSVKQFGVNFLDHINNGMIPPELYEWKAQAMFNSFGQGASAYAANSVHVPVNIQGFSSPAMASELRNNIEDTVVKIMRKYS